MKVNLLSHMPRRVWLIGAGALAVLLLSLILTQDRTEQPSWTRVRRGPFAVTVTETGEVRAVQQIDVKAPMEWRMQLQVLYLAPEGSVVEEGQLLAQFDTAELQKRLDLAEDRLISALAQEKKLLAEQGARMQQLEGDLRTSEYSRDIAVLQRDLMKYEAQVRRQDVELEHQKALLELGQAQTQIEAQKIIDRAALRTAQLVVADERLEKRELEGQIQNLSLRAPIRGMLVYNEIGRWENRKKIALGDNVNPGEALVSIPNLDSMQVSLRVNEMDVSRIQIGQPAVVSLDAYPNSRFSGRVAHMAKLAQKENWNSMIKDFEVIVRLDRADSLFKPGMTARAEILVQPETTALFMPLGALYEIDGRPVIFRKTDYPRPTPVVPGERTDAWVSLNSSQVREGDLIAWKSPDAGAKRIGLAADLQRLRADEKFWQQTFGEMNKRGLRYEYGSSSLQPAATDGGNEGTVPVLNPAP